MNLREDLLLEQQQVAVVFVLLLAEGGLAVEVGDIIIKGGKVFGGCGGGICGAGGDEVAIVFELKASQFRLAAEVVDGGLEGIEDGGDAFLLVEGREVDGDLFDLFCREVFGAVADGLLFDGFQYGHEAMEEVVGGGAVAQAADAHDPLVEQCVVVGPAVDVELAAHADDDVAPFGQEFHGW